MANTLNGYALFNFTNPPKAPLKKQPVKTGAQKPVALKSGHTANTKTLDLSASLGFDVVIKRSARRRTIEIVIRSGKVHLMLPQFVAEAEGLAFVASKQEWIRATLVKHQDAADALPKKEYQRGAEFDYLGKAYPVEIFRAAKPQVIFNELGFHVGIRHLPSVADEVQIKKAMTQWFKERAEALLTEKTLACAKQINRSVSAVKLRATKTKWGHCTSDGVIQYNWQIIAAPEWVIDYLVAHEVSHLVHRHHRPIFWRHVEKLCPDYQAAKAWLKTQGSRIVF